MEAKLPIYMQAARVLYEATGLELVIRHVFDGGESGLMTLQRKDKPRGEVDFEFRTILAGGASAGMFRHFISLHENMGYSKIGRDKIFLADYIDHEAQQHLLKKEINFCDCAGNFHIETEHFYLHQTGFKPITKERKIKSNGFDTAGIRLILGEFIERRFINRPFRELTKATGSSQGAIGKALAGLAESGYLLNPDNSHKRKLIIDKGCIDRWVLNFTERVKPKQLIGKYLSRDPNWWKSLDLHSMGAYWGGEVAAAKLTNALTPEVSTVYINPEKLRPLLMLSELSHAPNDVLNTALMGYPVEVYQVFGPANLMGSPDHISVVHPLIAYAELMGTKDLRNHEVARIIYDDYIATNIRY